MIDYECSWWPDEWFGISLTKCCIQHDLGGSDWQLVQCVADQHPLFIILGIAMFIGLLLGRPFYRMWRKINDNKINKP